MNESPDIRPGTVEIKAQLDVLLASPRLVSSPSQAALLEVIVRQWLEKKPTDERTVGLMAFPQFIPGRSTDVRANAFSLRKTLRDYYENEGAMDLVIIEILKGRNYGVRPSYNPKSEALLMYER